MSQMIWFSRCLCASVSLGKYLFRRRRHLHCPNCCWAHVHGRAVMAVLLPCFRSTEPISLSFVGGVIHAPGGAVAFVFEAIAEHQRGDAEGGSGPDFLHL